MSRSKGWFMIIISLLFTLYFAYNAIAITYEYDDSNRMTVVTYDVGKYVYYYYDNNGNLLRTKMSWDIEPPKTGLIFPTNNSTLHGAGNVVVLSAYAESYRKMDWVEFYIDDALVGQSVYAPYKCNWLSTVGKHTVMTKAYDVKGDYGISDLITIKVPATISINNPLAGSELTGNVGNFSAVSSDPLLGWVALSIDGTAVDSVYLAEPASMVMFDYIWDTTQYLNGVHEIKVSGSSEADDIYSQSKVNVTVYNPVSEIPVVRIMSLPELFDSVIPEFNVS